MKMDPSLSKFMKYLKRQANGWKISSVAGVTPSKTTLEVVSPEVAIAPVANKKRGHPPKAQLHPEVEASSGRAINMLGLSLKVVPTMQFDLHPEDEGILAAVHTMDLVEEMVELQCRAAVVSRAIGNELKRAQSVVIPKLKVKLEDSALSLKNALQATEACQEERRKESELAKEEQETLKATLAKVMAERDAMLKEKAESEAQKEALSAEIAKCQEFMLRIKASIKVFVRWHSFMACRLKTRGII